jgi:hypothetical protein
MAKAIKHPVAVFNTKKYVRIGDFILKARAIAQDITANVGTFATPNPTMANFQNDIQKLETAEANALTHVAGSASARDLIYTTVLADIRSLLSYVQGLADKAPNYQAAVNIIQLAGFEVKGINQGNKSALKVTYDKTMLTYKLLAKAVARRAAYHWQYSTDGGTTWVDMPVTLKASTTLIGVASTGRMAFRFKTITNDGESDWSDVVSG